MDTSTLIMALLPVILIELALIIFCLVDLLRRDISSVRGQNKWIWAIVIIVFNLLGSIVYLVFGRTEESAG